MVLRVALGVLGGRPGSPHGRSVFWRARARGLVGLLGGSSAGLGVVFGDLGMVFAGSWGGLGGLGVDIYIHINIHMRSCNLHILATLLSNHCIINAIIY